MGWFLHEKVTSSSGATANLRSYNASTGLITLYHINGTIKPGDTIYGQDSGMSVMLNNFKTFDYDSQGFPIEEEYSKIQYEDTRWDEVQDNLIYVASDVTSSSLDSSYSADYVALEEHFNGKDSQDYQVTYLVVQDGS